MSLAFGIESITSRDGRTEIMKACINVLLGNCDEKEAFLDAVEIAGTGDGEALEVQLAHRTRCDACSTREISTDRRVRNRLLRLLPDLDERMRRQLREAMSGRAR